MKKHIDTQALHQWFQTIKRSFSWRKKPTPYRVWISEVMLQQTRASVVIPYFERWIELFPDVQSLANASLEEVIKAWEGLGYYGRARNLHEGAKQIVSHYRGKIPSKPEHLEKIKGLGPYMVRAILSFAFHKRAAPVDGNVLRVLSRQFLIEEDIGKSYAKKKIQALADEILDEKKPWVTAEALIELGATLCQTKPLCEACPIRQSCLAFKENKTDALPIKSLEMPTTILTRIVAVIEEKNFVLLRKGPKGKVMADLYEFPYFEGLEKPLVQHINASWGLETSFIKSLPFVKHSFTRYQAHLFPIYLHAFDRKPVKDCVWVSLDEICELPFSSGHRRILENFIKRLDPQLTFF